MRRAERGSRRRAPAGAFAVLLAAILCLPQAGRASDVPEAGFVEPDAAVLAGVFGVGVLYLGGAFETLSGSSFPHLAAINPAQGTSFAAWKPEPNAAVRAMAISANGTRLYIGGEFTQIGAGINAAARGRLAALDLSPQILLTGNRTASWNADGEGDTNGAVRAMALSPDGRTLFIGGDFTEVGGVARNHIASVSAATGAVLPWDPNANGTVRALALSADGATLYVGGDFGTIGSQARRGLAAVSTVNGKATGWDPALASGAVHSLVRAGTTLYAGGSFGQIGGAARDNLAALDTTVDSGMATGWNPGADGTVRALALSGDGARLYAGGVFSTVNGVIARESIAGFRTDVDTADAITWDPGLDSAIVSIDVLLSPAGGSDLYAGGDFTRIGATDLGGLAVFDIAAPQTAVDPAGGGYRTLSGVTLTCTDRSGAGCAEIYYTTDGSDPDTPVVYTAPVEVTIAGDTTLRYFSVDADGNREAVQSAVYALDNAAPSTLNSLNAGLYGSTTVEDVELECTDDHPELGCATYYTLDNTTPTTASAVYTGPISLADLFPPPGIDPDEVDPLLHLAGTVTLKYFSLDDAGNAEDAQTVIYQIDLSGPRAEATHASGNYAAPIAVTLSCNDGTGSGCAEMYYTLDNTTPSDGTVTDQAGNVIPRTARYTGPITIDDASVLRVLALDVAGNQTSGIIGIYSFTADVGQDSNRVGGTDFILLLMLLAMALAGGYRRRRRPHNPD